MTHYEHNLYKTGDKDAHDAIKDGNGEVVLQQCRKCGLGEIELDEHPCCQYPDTQPLAIKAWQEFSKEVETHLANYSIPQYGDLHQDEISKYSIEMCIAQMQRYLSRHGKNQRSSEDERTFMKVAVYAFRAHLKMSEPQQDLVFIEDASGGKYLKPGTKYVMNYIPNDGDYITTIDEIDWKIA